MNRLWVRLSLGFLLVVAVAVGVMALAVNRATEASFRGYVARQNAASTGDDQIARLESYYAEQGSWDGVEEALPRRGQGRGQGQGQGADFLVADESGRVVAATDPEQVGRALTQVERNSQADPLRHDGQIVGYFLRAAPSSLALSETQTQFLQEVQRWLLTAGLGAAGVALLLGLGLAWQLTRPLGALTDAARRMAGGELDQRVRGGGAQEMVALADAFNRLSAELSRVEGLRQRMTADIAHELRTPVSVMRGQLEAMLDGVLPSDAEHVAVVYDQTLHLARLVDDLRTLTQVEAGKLPLNRRVQPPAALVERACASFAPLAADAGFALDCRVSPDLPPVNVDADRIQQVLANLLSNALRHTAAGGEIRVQAAADGGRVRFSVSNSGPSMTPEQAAHVFERFWRAEAARQRDKGGAGLGLPIAQGIVALHGGRIWVETAENLTTFAFEIPADSSRHAPAG